MAWLIFGWLAAAEAQSTLPPSTIPQTSPFYSEQAPIATLEPNIQPVDPNWDPYDPNASPPALLPDQGFIYTRPDGTLGTKTPLVGQLRVEYTFIPGDGGDDLQINDIETFGTFTCPLHQGAAPILITPGFGAHFWDGPDSGVVVGRDLPGEVYDAYLDFGWRPQLTPHISADLAIRPGVYGDFKFTDSDTFRIKGRALGIYTHSPQWQWVAGIVYLDRLDIKMLPAGGVIWTPNEATRLEILFPRPKLSWRLNTVGNTEWWWYVAAEYGGDSWTIKRASGLHDRVDYNDIRVAAGMEWNSYLGYRGNVEVGYSFDREVIYKSGTPTFEPGDTVFFRGGLSY